MKLVFFTIALNCREFLKRQLDTLHHLQMPWEWKVVEGVAALVNDTSRRGAEVPASCHDQYLSVDGTTQFLDSAPKDRVSVYRQGSAMWNGKTAMCNAALSGIKEPCILMQMDADEFWQPWQLHTLYRMFMDKPDRTAAWFWNRVFVGKQLVMSDRNCDGNHPEYEWLRAWRFEPGMQFKTHEPPCLTDRAGLDVGKIKPFTHAETASFGLIFDHMSYVSREQVAFKEKYYGLNGLVAGWEQLQQCKTFPVLARDFLPWVKDQAKVYRFSDRINLLVPWYRDKDHKRDKELKVCVVENHRNQHFSTRTYFTEVSSPINSGCGLEGGELFEGFKACDDDCLLIHKDKRPTYADLVRYANSNFPGETCIIANADIFFDETLAQLKGVDLDSYALALTRHEVMADGSLRVLANEGGYCQDAWVFKAPLVIDGNFEFGRIGCDNRMAWELEHIGGRKVINPCGRIRACHLHLTGVRNYSPHDRIPGPWAAVFSTSDWPFYDTPSAPEQAPAPTGAAAAVAAPVVQDEFEQKVVLRLISGLCNGSDIKRMNAGEIARCCFDFAAAFRLERDRRRTRQ